MELIKKNIYMNKLKGKTVTQITLDDDFNVPDSKMDMEQIILDRGELRLDESRPMNDKVSLSGRLKFDVLYSTPASGSLESMSGEIPFDELVNMEELEERDRLQTQWEMEDLTVEMIHSRKLSVKAIITFTLTAEQLYEEETAVEARDIGEFDSLNKELDVTQIAMQKHDTYRLKEEIELPGSKPNINQLLWNHVELRGMECRPLDGKLSLRGELLFFTIYNGEEEHIPIQWLEKSIAFSGVLELPDCVEEMIPAIDVRLAHREVTAIPDFDGENRVISLEAVLDLDIRLYEEVRIEILNDVYSPVKELIHTVGTAFFESLLMKNTSKYKLVDKLKIKGGDKILQICHSNGSVKIDDIRVVEDGIAIEGALCVSLLYISSDDREPMRSLRGAIPFSYTVEAKGVEESCVFQLKPGLEQLNALMLGGDEVEIKAVITFDALVLKKVAEEVITDVREEELDMDKLERMPGIVGYIVQPGDSLWKIAKRFYTTINSLKATNGLTADEVKPGDRLLVIKQVEQL